MTKRLDHTKWCFDSASWDVGSLLIDLESEESARKQLAIHNVYNPVKSTEGRAIVIYVLERILESTTADEQMVLGDFNLYHSMWGGDAIGQTE